MLNLERMKKGAIIMLLWIFVILLIGGIICWIFIDDNGFAFAAMVAGVIGLIVCVPIAIGTHASVDGDLLKFQNYRQSIEYKLNSGLYEDEFGVYDKEIINEIRHYNECVINRQRYIGNFWVGIFNPNDFSELEIIDYDIVPVRDKGR